MESSSQESGGSASAPMAVEAPARAAFRPSRPRPSLPAFNGENEAPSTTGLGSSRKRAQSLGGDALNELKSEIKANKRARVSMINPGELSPGKIARRKLVPRRSILKPYSAFSEDNTTNTFDYSALAGVGAHTTDLSSLSSVPFGQKSRRQSIAHTSTTLQAANAANQKDQQDEEVSEEEDEDSGDDMDITQITQFTMNEDRRKSLMARRVSFAPNAHIRTFTPDKPTAEAQALRQQQLNAAASSSPARSSLGADDSREEDEDESMEMAAGEVTSAFKFAGHFRGTVDQSVYDDEEDDDQEGGEEEEVVEEEEEEEDMEEADPGSITGAFGSQFSLPQSSSAAALPPPAPVLSFRPSPSKVSPEKRKPRFSEVFRQDDADDAAMMAELGMVRGRAAQFESLSQSQSQSQPQPESQQQEKRKPRISEFVRGFDTEDDEVFQQLGLTKGKAGPNVSASSMGSGAEDKSGRGEDEDEEDGQTGRMDGETMEMTVAIGGVLSTSQQSQQSLANPPSQPEEIDEEEMEEEDNDVDMSMATTAAGGDHTANMEEATSHGQIFTSHPLAGVPTPSTPSARLRAQLFRQSLGADGTSGMPSPFLNSPRRRVFGNTRTSPQKQPVSKSPRRSPIKFSMSASTSRIPSTSVPVSPGVNRTAMRASSTSPVKKSTAMTTSPKKSTTPVKPPMTFGNLAPSSATRTPGGSLSLKGLMNLEQEKEKRAAQVPVASRVGELRASAAEQDEDVTGSSFGGSASFSEREPSAPITSIDDFFSATDMHFHKDISSFAGVDWLQRGAGRKSIAPTAGREPSGPPSFADIVVAGACTSNFFHLYRADQSSLSERIEMTIQALNKLDAGLEIEQPVIFREWQEATEEHRQIMLNQFRMIKTHYFLQGRIEWMDWRSQNIGQIIDVMHDNLAGLRLDNEVIEASKFDEVLPGLQDRHNSLAKELSEERKRDKELTECDQDTLLELQQAIIEQTEQLQIHERSSAESKSQLQDLKAKAKEYEELMNASVQENEDMRHALEMGRISTKAEVFRLNSEYETLQQIHGWKLQQFSATAVRLSHLDEFDLTLQVANGVTHDAIFTLYKKPNATTGLMGEVTRFLFSKVIEHVQSLLKTPAERQALHPRVVIAYTSALWTCARRVRREIFLANLRFPTRADLLHNGRLRVSIEIHVPVAMSTFNVVIELTGDELASDEERRAADIEMVLASVTCDVHVKFGKVDHESLRYIVRERLDGGGRNALVEACNEAEEKCR
ncbi:hypothetical protein T439DRAFT_381667 [Meredithblackwellia eburnea MCA 4105]